MDVSIDSGLEPSEVNGDSSDGSLDLDDQKYLETDRENCVKEHIGLQETENEVEEIDVESHSEDSMELNPSPNNDEDDQESGVGVWQDFGSPGDSDESLDSSSLIVHRGSNIRFSTSERSWSSQYSSSSSEAEDNDFGDVDSHNESRLLSRFKELNYLTFSNSKEHDFHRDVVQTVTVQPTQPIPVKLFSPNEPYYEELSKDEEVLHNEDPDEIDGSNDLSYCSTSGYPFIPVCNDGITNENCEDDAADSSYYSANDSFIPMFTGMRIIENKDKETGFQSPAIDSPPRVTSASFSKNWNFLQNELDEDEDWDDCLFIDEGQQMDDGEVFQDVIDHETVENSPIAREEMVPWTKTKTKRWTNTKTKTEKLTQPTLRTRPYLDRRNKKPPANNNISFDTLEVGSVDCYKPIVINQMEPAKKRRPVGRPRKVDGFRIRGELARRAECPLCSKELNINSFYYHLKWAKIHEANRTEARLALKEKIWMKKFVTIIT